MRKDLGKWLGDRNVVLGRWGRKYVERRMALLFDFHCFGCGEEIRGVSMAKHLLVCKADYWKAICEQRNKELLRVMDGGEL